MYMFLAQITPADPTAIETILQMVVGYPLLALFVWLYARAQNSLVAVQKDAAAAIVKAQSDASAQVAAIYKEMADQRREELAQMRALLFDLARRGIQPGVDETQPLPKAEINAALAQHRADKAIAGASAVPGTGQLKTPVASNTPT